MAKAKPTTAPSNSGSATLTEPEPMPIVGATTVDKELDGPHDAVEYLDAPSDDQIRECAYQCWVNRGSPEGSPECDWHEAERKLRSASQRS
jgi:hypothetical protein